MNTALLRILPNSPENREDSFMKIGLLGFGVVGRGVYENGHQNAFVSEYVSERKLPDDKNTSVVYYKDQMPVSIFQLHL